MKETIFVVFFFLRMKSIETLFLNVSSTAIDYYHDICRDTSYQTQVLHCSTSVISRRHHRVRISISPKTKPIEKFSVDDEQ